MHTGSNCIFEIGTPGIETIFYSDLSENFFLHLIVLLYSDHLGLGADSSSLLVFRASLDWLGKVLFRIKLDMACEMLWRWSLTRYRSCGRRPLHLLSLDASCQGKVWELRSLGARIAACSAPMTCGCPWVNCMGRSLRFGEC